MRRYDENGKKIPVLYENILGCTPEILSKLHNTLEHSAKTLYGDDEYSPNYGKILVIDKEILEGIKNHKGLTYIFLDWIIREGYYELIYFLLPTIVQNNTPESSKFIRTYVQCICSIYSQIDSPLICEQEKQKILKRLINQNRRQELEEKLSSPKDYYRGQTYIQYHLKRLIFDNVLRYILYTLADNPDRDWCEDVIQSISFVDNDYLIEYCLKITKNPEYFLNERFSEGIRKAAQIKIDFYQQIASLSPEYVEMFRELCKHQIEWMGNLLNVVPIDKECTFGAGCMLITPINNEDEFGEYTLKVPEVLRGRDAKESYAYYTLLELIDGKISLNPAYCSGRLARVFSPLYNDTKNKN